ncbi:THUM3 protein, partial [Polypterus senegalus]|nr:THUMP domain-containing protein 3 [Polypterus senegalus]XP_039628878.1 THUMP domain-containing protein 3 [Polypterus senegalus]MBN3294014.1 THUM3 protein [Polypterus senegalus]
MSEGRHEAPVKRDGALADETPSPDSFSVVIGATVPTGFEYTAADEVREKLGAESRISKDRGRIYFEVRADSLPQVHQLKSVDNLFVVVKEFPDYHFKDTKEETLEEFEELASKLPWLLPLEVWKLNNTLKKRRSRRKGVLRAACPGEISSDGRKGGAKPEPQRDPESADSVIESNTASERGAASGTGKGSSAAAKEESQHGDVDSEEETGDSCESQDEGKKSELLKFRVTCSRAGEKHNFTSNEAARDFGGAVQDFFLWKPDMTKFDIEVLLNIHNEEVVVGISLTEESLHRRNITHFGPTTLRSTLAYGMLRLCDPLPSDVIIDPMCGSGAIPLEGSIEWPHSFFISGDNNTLATNRTVNNINYIHKKRQNKGSSHWGLRIDTLQWDICRLPIRTGSVDTIVTDMPFGKRMGSRKKNWDLYPSCLKEMGRICRPETGKAVLLTQDKKCFAKAVSRMGHLWRRSHTVWVNVGGLHAAVYLLKRTALAFEKAEARANLKTKSTEEDEEERRGPEVSDAAPGDT